MFRVTYRSRTWDRLCTHASMFNTRTHIQIATVTVVRQTPDPPPWIFSLSLQADSRAVAMDVHSLSPQADSRAVAMDVHSLSPQADSRPVAMDVHSLSPRAEAVAMDVRSHNPPTVHTQVVAAQQPVAVGKAFVQKNGAAVIRQAAVGETPQTVGNIKTF